MSTPQTIRKLAFLITEDYFNNWKNVRQLLLLPAKHAHLVLPASEKLKSVG